MERHFQIETNVFGYAIGRVLSQLTIKRDLAGWATYKTNNQPIYLLFEIG